jgi:hypothetical protein
MGTACSTHGRDEKYIVLVRKPEGPRHRWEDSIKGAEGNRLGRCGFDASVSG